MNLYKCAAKDFNWLYIIAKDWNEAYIKASREILYKQNNQPVLDLEGSLNVKTETPKIIMIELLKENFKEE